MFIITIRTDKPEAEIALYDDNTQLAAITWQAHRTLAETLHSWLAELLAKEQKTFSDVQGIAVFQGPGSFTGLRIGITVGNALAYSLNVPIVAAPDPDWAETARRRLLAGERDELALPEYGALPHITAQKK